MADKLTPTRFAQVKTISGSKNGRGYSFNSVGFQCREFGDRWFNFAFNGENPLREGQTVELDIKERTYKDKDGNDKIAYDAKRPNPMADFAKTIMALLVRVGNLERRVESLEPKARITATPAQMTEPPDDVEGVNAELAGSENDPNLPF